VVLCHPHPLYGLYSGTMHNAIVVFPAKALYDIASNSIATLRFNYRGVEASSGAYDNGKGEVRDVIAAIDEAIQRTPRAAISVVGYSFGSWVGLRAARQRSQVERVVLIAPAMRLFDYEQELAGSRQIPTEMLVGNDDDFVTVADARGLAASLGARLHVLENADHFFDENPEIASRFQVRSIPLLIAFHDEDKIASQVGALPAAQLRAWVEKALQIAHSS